MLPITNDDLARRARKAAKAAKKAEKKAKRVVADPQSKAIYFNKQQEEVDRKEEKEADRKQREAAKAECEKLSIARNIDASIKELVAKKRALLSLAAPD